MRDACNDFWVLSPTTREKQRRNGQPPESPSPSQCRIGHFSWLVTQSRARLNSCRMRPELPRAADLGIGHQADGQEVLVGPRPVLPTPPCTLRCMSTHIRHRTCTRLSTSCTCTGGMWRQIRCSYVTRSGRDSSIWHSEPLHTRPMHSKKRGGAKYPPFSFSKPLSSHLR